MIGNSDLQTILDKLARFAGEAVGDSEFNAAFDAGLDAAWNNTLKQGAGGLVNFTESLNDLQLNAYLAESTYKASIANLSPPDSFLLNIPEVKAIITALDNYFKANGYASLDAYLTSLNSSTPSLRVHAAFSKNLKKLSRGNVFVGADTALASLVATGATTGTFSKLTTLSTYAGAKLVVKNVGALGATTGVTVTAKKLDGTTATLTASVTTLTNGAETNLNDVTKSFVEVTGVAVTGATTGNQINIVAKTDRDISAA